ncbi:hypothetical protein GOP47_0010120 [Adiantum capillus-veneris]|uniref:PPIase cyclophilin-type domain-containing protein n=1 Tax=Adiantum capillus-veneris TaxID=13818 RepID=A0A9D4UUP3_ADICA|nr:hypothetical protein GOP47_0010120 [Adiantum capillus-veneris]
MASAGPNLNASQFYITLRQAPIDYLDGNRTVFGRVTKNFDKALEKINYTLVDQHSFRPLRNIGIKQVYILYDPFEDPVGLAHILSMGLSMPHGHQYVMKMMTLYVVMRIKLAIDVVKHIHARLF